MTLNPSPAEQIAALDCFERSSPEAQLRAQVELAQASYQWPSPEAELLARVEIESELRRSLLECQERRARQHEAISEMFEQLGQELNPSQET